MARPASAAPAPSRGPRRAPAPPPAPTPRRHSTTRTALPWHLRRSFLLPVVGVCLLGSLSCLTLLGFGYASVRATGGRLGDVVLSASDSSRTAAAGAAGASARTAGSSRRSSGAAPTGGTAGTAPPVAAPASAAPSAAQSATTSATTSAATSAAASAAPPVAPTTTRTPAGTASRSGAGAGDAADAAAGSGATGAAGQGSDPAVDESSARTRDGGAPAGAAQTVRGDVTYEGFGSARSASVDYTVDGEFDGTTTGGASFLMPQKGSASWKGWYVSVTATDGGQAGCRIHDASGVLVEHTAARPGDTAECAWGEQGDGVPQDQDPAAGDPGDG